jgi:hypothetical protein
LAVGPGQFSRADPIPRSGITHLRNSPRMTRLKSFRSNSVPDGHSSKSFSSSFLTRGRRAVLLTPLPCILHPRAQPHRSPFVLARVFLQMCFCDLGRPCSRQIQPKSRKWVRVHQVSRGISHANLKVQNTKNLLSRASALNCLLA